MSRNFIKGGYVVVSSKEKVTIDHNEKIAKHLEELAACQRREEADAENDGEGFSEGFVEGIAPSKVELLTQDVSLLPSKTLEETNEECEAILREAKEEADRILAEAKAELERKEALAAENGYQRGYEEGFKAAEGDCQNKYDGLLQELNKKSRELDSEYQRKVEELEPAMVDTLTDIYEHVLGISLAEEKKTILFLLNRALQNMESGRNYMIHVSMEDYEEVVANKETIASGSGISEEAIDIIEDNTMKKNDCLIESDCGIFDCGLGVQFALLKKQLKILSYEKSTIES